MVETGTRWKSRIIYDKQEHPIFYWYYQPECLVDCDVLAYSCSGVYKFIDRRSWLVCPVRDSYTLQEILEELERFGLGKPPYIEEIDEDIKRLSKLIVDDYKKFLVESMNLELHWKQYCTE